MTSDEQITAQEYGTLMLMFFNAGDWKAAYYTWRDAVLNSDQRAAIWENFDSQQRAFLKGEDRQYLEGYEKKICPACGKVHWEVFTHCRECKWSIDRGEG